MSGEIVIELPPLAYAQLQAMATAQQRAVAAIASDLILAELPVMPALPEDVEQELAAFDQLSDDVLVLLANSSLNAQEQTELAELNEQAQSRGLLPADAERREHLLARYDRMLVRRAQAALVLRRRGHTQSPLQ